LPPAPEPAVFPSAGAAPASELERHACDAGWAETIGYGRLQN
jgi:hypothetical protein